MQQRVIVILGMHRSGTSCLTGTLQEAGLYLGNVHRENPFNRKGNRENPEIMALHEDVLTHSGGSWLQPPPACRWLPRHATRRDTIIASYRAQKLWGFKDPRSLITIPFWREALPELERVGIFRHPTAVAASLRARDPALTFSSGLTLWREYNRRLLEEYQRAPFPVIEFVDNQQQLLESLCHIRQILSLPEPARATNFFDAGLQHQRGNSNVLDVQTRSLYEQLQALVV